MRKIIIHVSNDLEYELDRIANKKKIHINQLIEEILKKYLEEMDEENFNNSK